MIPPKLHFQFKSPDQLLRFNVEVRSSESITKQKVIKIIGEQFENLNTLTSKKRLSVFLNNKEVEIVIKPLTLKDYLQPVDQLIRLQKNWLEKIGAGLMKVVRWVFHLKGAKTIKRMELALAMHLFRNADSAIFQKLTKQKGNALGQIPLSTADALGIWNHFFKEIDPFLSREEKEAFKEFLPGLKNLESYQKKIDHLRELKGRSSRVKARKKLEQELLKKAERAFDEGKSFFMPGGYINPKSGESETMFYELSKKENGTINLRVVDLSGNLSKESSSGGTDAKRVAPSVSGEVADLEQFMNRALRAQIGPPHILYQKKLSKFDAIKMLIFGAEKDEEEGEREELLKELSAELKPDAPLTVKQKVFAEPEKLVEVFFKTTKPELYEGSKNLLKVTSFITLYRQMGSQLTDPEVRRWMRANAKGLLESFEKVDRDKSPVGLGNKDTDRTQRDLSYIQRELKKIIDYMDHCDQTQAVEVPSPKGQQKSKTSFGERIRAPIRSQAFKTVEVRASAVAPLSDIRLDGIKTREVREALLGQYAKEMKNIRLQVEKKNWKNGAQLLEDFSHLLDRLKESDLLTHLTEEEVSQWSGLIHNFGLASAQVSSGLGNIVPTPAFIHYTLQGLVLGDMICRRFLPESFTYFYFDMAPISQILKDPYLSLGSYGPSIERHLSYLRSPPNPAFFIPPEDLIPIRLTTAHPFGEKCYNNDHTFYAHMAQVIETDAVKLYDDIGQKKLLPSSIAHLRQQYLLAQVLMAPTRTLSCFMGTLETFVTVPLQFLEAIQGGGLFSEKSIDKVSGPASVKVVVEQIRKHPGALELSIQKNSAGSQLHYIKKWVVTAHDFDQKSFYGGPGTNFFAFEHPQLYRENGIAVDDEKVQKVLFEQNVGEVQADRVTDEGKISYTQYDQENDLKYKKFGVAGKTQLAILREKLSLQGLPSDLIQEIQLMHTGSVTRIKETAGKLCKHAGLLNDGAFAPMLQRLFERNFFRDNLLIAQLVADPAYARTLFEQLREAAVGQKDSHQHRSYLFLIDLVAQVYNTFNEVGGQLDDVDEIAALENLGQEIKSFLMFAREELKELKEMGDSGIEPYARYQRELHVHSLLMVAQGLGPELKKSQESPQLDAQELKDVLKSYLLLQTVPETFPIDPQKQEQLDYLMHRLRPEIKAVMEKETERDPLCNALLHFLYPQEKKEPVWQAFGKSGLLFKSGKYTIDLQNGTVWENKMRRSPIPAPIFKHPDFEGIQTVLKESGFEGDLKDISTVVRTVKMKKEFGNRYDFSLEKEGKTTSFRMILTEDNQLRFYKKVKSEWFQFQPDLIPSGQDEENKIKKVKGLIEGKEKKQPFPRELRKQTCWIREDGRQLLAEKNGVLVYIGRLNGSPPKIASLREVSTKKELLNPWRQPRFNVFKRIEDSAHITVKGKKGKGDEVVYNRFNLSFKWDRKKEKWVSPQHTDYFLSSRTLRDYFTSREELDASTAPHDLSELREVFSGTFTNYQLLESENGWPKVVLAGTEYRKVDPEKNKFILHLQKRSDRLSPHFDPEKKENLPLFTYTADPNKGLVCDVVPDGYLYLAYTLMAQGKYKEAIRYLKKGDLNRPLSPLGNTIMGWITRHLDTSPESAAFKMHVTLMQMRQSEFTKPGARSSAAAQQLGVLAAFQYKDYRKLVKEGKIPLELQLRDEERKDFARIGEKSLFYVGYKLASHQKGLEKLNAEFGKIANDLSALQDPSIQAEQKALKLIALAERFSSMQTDPDLQEINKLLEKLHFSLAELYQWHETGVLQKMMKEGVDPQEAVQEVVAFEVQHQIRLKSSLRSEIAQLESTIQQNEKRAKKKGLEKGLENPILLLPIEFRNHFVKVEVDQKKIGQWQQKLASFKEAATFQGQEVAEGEAYAHEIGKELAEDLAFDLENEGVSLKGGVAPPPTFRHHCPPKKIEAHLADIESTQNRRLANARKYKLEALQNLPNPPQKKEWKELLDRIKEENTTWQEALFDTALRCTGENDWTPMKDLFSSEEEFQQKAPLIAQACKEYLKEAVISQHCARVKQTLYQLKELDPGSEDYEKKSQEIYEMVGTGWAYDPDKDPDALSFLLIEYELGFICRKSQVDVVRSSLHEDNQFKQEICGGGKTTVLRNVIAHWRADGVSLSGVSTLEPLRKEHGLLFSRTTKHAFGEKSFDFVFDRKTPSDEASLLKLYRNLLKMVVERGRVDLTKNDLLSFKLEMVLKQEQIAELRKNDPGSSRLAALNRELDLMETIRDLFRARAFINADELDKDCDATQEKNYAHGERISFNEYKVEGGLELMRQILKATAQAPALFKLGTGLRNNQQSKLSGKELADAKKELASLLFDTYQEELALQNKENFIAYMTGIKQDPGESDHDFQRQIKEFYDLTIKPGSGDPHHALKSKLCFMHEFLTQVVSHAASKKGGVNFGRSEDRIHVIPYEGSDNPREGSQHGLESEQIWYGLMDYADLSRGGVSPDQISLLVETKRKQAIQEVERSRKLTPDTAVEFEKTKAAQEFKKTFGFELANLGEADFKSISSKINSDPDLLIDFVRDWVLPEYQLHSHNIVSDSQDPPSMVHSYSGSSGTDNAKYSMPDPIDVSRVRQPGVHGKIIRSLIEIHESQSEKRIESFLSYTDTYGPKNLLHTLAAEVKGGDCLSDVGVAFPGVPAVEIARSLSRLRPELTLRFMNRNDEWKMFRNGKVVPVDPNIPLGEIFTIFDDTHTRGAERPSKEGVTEYVTIDENTPWSKFEQGVLRERGVTKGKAAVRYLISPSLYKKWGGAPSLETLFQLLIRNEAEQLKPVNCKAEKQKIRAIARHGVEEALREVSRKGRREGSPAHHHARELIHEKTKKYFIRPNEARAEEAGEPAGMKNTGLMLQDLAYSEMEKVLTLIDENGELMEGARTLGGATLEVVRGFCAHVQKNVVPRLQAKTSSQIESGLEAYKPRIEDRLLPKEVPNREGDLDNEQAVEQEQEQEMEVEQEQEQEQEVSIQGKEERTEIPHEPLELNLLPWKTVAHMLCGEEKIPDRLGNKILPFQSFSPYLPKNKFFTENFSPVFRDQKRGVRPWSIVRFGQNLPPDQNRVSRTLFVINTKTGQVGELVSSLKDNDTDVEKFVRENKQSALQEGMILSIYNYDTGRVDGGEGWEGLTVEQAERVNQQIVTTKFFNGEVRYGQFPLSGQPTAKEVLLNQYKTLVDWLTDSPENLDDLERSFKKFIRENRISHPYDGSDIHRAFIEARKARL